MKKIILLWLAFYSFASAFSQTSNVILFTENGEKFTVILNGLKQNSKPETNVKIADLLAPQYKLKIIFEDIKLGESAFNLFMEPGLERTFSISKNKKAVYVLRLISEVEVAGAPQPPPSQTIYNYNSNGTPIPVRNPNDFSMGINMNEQGVNINIQAPGVVNTNVSGVQSYPDHQNPTTEQQLQNVVVCQYPMSPNDFVSLKSSVQSKSFEDSKMTVVKQALSTNCVTALQVRELMGLFTFEDSKLQLAKFAYDRTVDTNNYFKINDAFTFESSITEMNEFLNARKH